MRAIIPAFCGTLLWAGLSAADELPTTPLNPESAVAVPGSAVGDGATLSPLPETRTEPAATPARTGMLGAGEELILQALSYLGVKYRWGGNDPATGLDCSGYVQYVFRQAAGIALPHNAYSISLQGKSVTSTDLKPGDLVFFNTLKRAFSHVGIYLGEDRFIHAPSAGKSVEIVKMSDAYWAKRFSGARRIGEAAKQER
jgi:cell wall-associated NlpC family hydrolase